MQARAAVQEFGKNSEPASSLHMVDLAHLAALLSESPTLSASVQEVVSALDAAVVKAVQGAGIAQANGLSIYLPSNPGYYNPAYDSVAGIDGWRDALTDVFAALGQDTSGPVFTNPDKLADLAVDGSSLVVTGQLDTSTTADLASVSLMYGVADAANGVEYILGSNPAQLSDSGLVTGTWNTSVLTLTQGAATQYGYLALEADEASGTILASIPLAYAAPGAADLAEVIWLIAMDPTTGNALQSTYYLLSQAGPGELTPEPGSALYPLILQVDANGEQWVVSTQDGFDATQEISLDLQALNPGAVVTIYLLAQDYAGNTDFVWAGGEL
jgi:hypothetical protein